MKTTSTNVVSRFLLVTTVITLFPLFWQPNLAQASCAPPASGLVAWWPGEGNANDVIGGNNGTLTNGAAFTTGEVGRGFSLGTAHAGIIVGNPTNLQSQNFTIEAWIRRASTNVVTTDPTASEGHGIIFGYGSDGYAFGMNGPPYAGWLSLEKVRSMRITAGPLITDTNLHHVAVTKSGTDVVFYVDGLGYPFPLQPGFDMPFEFKTQAAIGVRCDALNGGDNRSFYGTIDEVSFYNRPLSAEEIAAIYAAGVAGKCRAGDTSNLTIDRNGGISFEGTVGATYRILYLPDLTNTNWTTFTNFVLPQSPYRVLDPEAPHASSRFYRVESSAN